MCHGKNLTNTFQLIQKLNITKSWFLQETVPETFISWNFLLPMKNTFSMSVPQVQESHSISVN